MDPAIELHAAIQVPSLRLIPTALILLIVLPLTALVGHRNGSTRRRRDLEAGKDIDTVVGETTLGAVLALLGLLLAFTFGHALTVSNAQKSALIKEANALGTAFARADFLPEPGRTALKAAILDYAKTRVPPAGGSIHSLRQLNEFLEDSIRAQDVLWPLTLDVTADPLPPSVKTFIAGAINTVLDSHHVRLQSYSAPVSDVANGMLFAAALAALYLLGDRLGMIGRPLTWRTYMLSAFLFIVMMTIVDTQRSGEGLIKVDVTPLRATILSMERDLQADAG